MAKVIRCTTCGKLSLRNYVTNHVQHVASSGKEFQSCREQGHNLVVVKVY